MRGVWRQSLSLPLLPVLGAGSRGPLPTCCGRGCAGVGTRRWSFGVHTLWGAACRGRGGRFPWGGGLLTVVRGVWCQALSLCRLLTLGAGGRAPLPIFGRGCGRGCGDTVWGHGLNSVACAPTVFTTSRRHALWGWQGGVPGGDASCRCEGRLGVFAHPLPAALCWGRQRSGSAAHFLWARACGCGDPALAIWCACLAGCGAPRAWWRLPWGVPLTFARGVWCQVSCFQLPVFGAGGRALVPVGCGGTGTHRRPHSVRLSEPALRAVGVARGRPGGGMPRAVVRGVCGSALILSRLPALGAGNRGPLSTCCGRGCAGVGTRHHFFGARALQGIARRGGGGRSPQGADLSAL